MDVEENQVAIAVTPSPEEQALLDKFSPFPFTREIRDGILARRSIMSDELVFDLLLEQASIASPQSLYPPDSIESLLHLFDAITTCGWDELKKACLQFYLLSHVSTDAAHKHAVYCALPPQFVHLAQACYLLDSGISEDLERAVSLLSDARIVQDLSSKILQILALAPYPNSSRLVRTYVRTAQPVLEDYEDLAIYLKALIDYSLADAWSFQRTFSETSPTRNLLIRTILDSCLIPPKPAVLPHFLSIPFTFFEFSLLQSYALTPPDGLSAASHAILQNLIAVRLLHSGKYSDAVRISRAFDALNTKLHSIATPMPLHKAAEERQQMMRDVLAVVPEVQRRQLELELSEEQGETLTSSLSASWADASNDISMSWENLGASSSKKASEKAVGGTRTGRLEGSPAPTLPERGSVITAFAPTTPNSTPKRHAISDADAYVSLTKETPTRAPLFPHIPTKPLAFRQTANTYTPPTNFRFQTPRPGLSRPIQGFETVNVPARSFGSGLNARNAFYEPEPSRTGSSPFLRQQHTANSLAVTPAKRNVNGEQTSPGTHMEKTIAEASATDKSPDATLRDPDDIVMVDSDDPDAFVVHGRRRSPVYLPEQIISDQNAVVGGIQKGTNGVASLFRRGADTTKKPEEERHRSVNRVLPGGFASVEFEDAPPASSSSRATHSPVREVSRAHRVRAQVVSPEQTPLQSISSTRLKIPGGLFEEDAEAEEQDHVPSLPPAPTGGGRRKRTTRLNGPVTDSEEDDQPPTPLRRSSRLSSTGPSPEPISPKRPEKKATSKRSTRSTDGTARRKRKNTDG